MAVKAAVAAAVAWLAVLPFGGSLDEYAYYAPLGAVVAVSTTFVGSARASLQSLAAILLGAVLSYGVGATGLPTVLALAAVVGLGVIVAGWPLLGEAGSWVPISALFILIIGNADRTTYVLAYLGLTSLGASIGIALNLLFPPLPLISTAVAVRHLRRTLAEQLEDLAEGLEREVPPTSSQWDNHKRAVDDRVSDMRQRALTSSEARSINWRARRWQDTSQRQIEEAQVLDRLSLVVKDLTLLIIERERADLEVVALGPQLRERCAQALRETAEVLREDDDDASKELIQTARHAVDQLGGAINDLHQTTGEDVFAAGAIVTALRQILVALESGDATADAN